MHNQFFSTLHGRTFFYSFAVFGGGSHFPADWESLGILAISVKENPSPACSIDLATAQVPIHPTFYLKSAVPLTGGTYSIRARKVNGSFNHRYSVTYVKAVSQESSLLAPVAGQTHKQTNTWFWVN